MELHQARGSTRWEGTRRARRHFQAGKVPWQGTREVTMGTRQVYDSGAQRVASSQKARLGRKFTSRQKSHVLSRQEQSDGMEEEYGRYVGVVQGGKGGRVLVEKARLAGEGTPRS